MKVKKNEVPRVTVIHMSEKITSNFISDIAKPVLCTDTETLETAYNFYYIINFLAF
jgi:hypothetical protein